MPRFKSGAHGRHSSGNPAHTGAQNAPEGLPASPRHTTPHSTRHTTRILTGVTLLLLMIVYIHSFFTRQLVAVTAVDLRDAFQLSNLQIGLLYGTFFSVFYAFAGIPMGRLTDRTSRKKMILTGLTLWSIATLLTGFATTFTALILFRILLGLSQAMLSPAVYSFLTDYAPEKHRATAFSIYAAGIFIGVGLSFLIGGDITQSASWEQAFKGGGLMGLLLVPVLFLALREPVQQSRIYATGMIHQTRTILRIQSVRWHLLGFSALACTGYTVLAFAGILLTDPFEAPITTTTTSSAISAIASVSDVEATTVAATAMSATNTTVAAAAMSATNTTSAAATTSPVQLFGWFVMAISITVFLSGKLADHAAKKDPSRRYNAGTVAALGGLPLYAAGFFTTSPVTALNCIGFGVLISSSYNGVAAALIQSYVSHGQRALTGGIYLFVISLAGFGLGPPAAGFLMDHIYSGPHASGKAVLTVMILCSTIATYAFHHAKQTHTNDALSG